jgi:hypothetical protein
MAAAIRSFRSALLAVLASCGLLPAAIPQPLPAEPSSADVRARAEALAAEAERDRACHLAIHGEPQRDTNGTWLVAYSASGDACDSASDALRGRGAALDIVFFRRPNAAEALGLANRIRTSIGSAFGCRIGLNDDLELDERTSWWSVSYVMAGRNCGDAMVELSRQWREAMISFVLVPGARGLRP